MTETAPLRQLELNILQDFKDQVNTNGVRNLAERICYLDVAFRKLPESVELQKEMLARISAIFEQKPAPISRNDVADLIINSYGKIMQPTEETSGAAIQLIVSKVLGTPEQIKVLPLFASQDLFIFLS